jgi:hypothetical protein
MAHGDITLPGVLIILLHGGNAVYYAQRVVGNAHVYDFKLAQEKPGAAARLDTSKDD